MRKVMWILCLMLTAIATQAQQDFRVVIINYSFGREQYETTITPDSLIADKKNWNGHDELNVQRLSAKQRNEINAYLKGFPLSSIKDKYINSHVEDGTQIGFYIRIGKVEKKIYVSNIYQKDLVDLCAEIAKFLPCDYINYNKKSVPWEE